MSERYIITEASVESGRVVYTAENNDGQEIHGRLSDRAAGPGTLLTENALEQMAEQIVGVEIDTSQVDIRCSELEEFSIAGDSGE